MPATDSPPRILQGGMGAGVSGWRLARAVSAAGELGVVSGTGLDLVLARRLELGDPDGALREALAAFPRRDLADAVLARCFRRGGKAAGAPFHAKPMLSATPGPYAQALLVVGAFVEVWLARRGHDGDVGINLLEKIQAPTLPTLYGAMLAGVAVVLMGAGVPRAIPGALDALARGDAVDLRLDVAGAAPEERFVARFDPRGFLGAPPPTLARPRFVAIVSSATLAGALLRKATGRVDGFVVEGPTAGGHNAPPRGPATLSASGEPVYGPRDVVDLAAMRALGVPFWLAGSYGRPGGLDAARREGAAGIQVGTAFAYCDESGMDPDVRRRVLAASAAGRAEVTTDPRASPTGFPIKVVHLCDTLSDERVYAGRTRVCDLGYLRHAYRRADGALGWRCPAEPVDDYVRKGGDGADTVGRKCVCNGLMATIGQAQVRADGRAEPAFVTSGDAVADVAAFVPRGAQGYTAADVLRVLLDPAAPPTAGAAGRPGGTEGPGPARGG